MLTRLSLVALLAMCPGAASSQQKENPARSCYQALAENPRLAPIREKVSLGGNLDEMRRLTRSGDRASQQEGAALAAWRNARGDCHQLELPYFATRDSEIGALSRGHFDSLQALILGLETGALTYGEFGARRVDLYERTTSRIEAVRRRISPQYTCRRGEACEASENR